MTSLHALAGNWIVHSLGWTLLHFCWQGAAVAAILCSALQLLGGHSSRARYAAGCCALALMVALPLATFGHIGLAEYRLGLVAGSTGVATVPGLVVGAGLGGDGWLARLAALLDPAIPSILLVWLAGSLLFLFRLSVGIAVTRKLRLLALSPVAAELQATFSRLRLRLGITRPVPLMRSALVRVPTVIGWLRPVVLIPASCFTGLPPAQIEAILCHELAHIRRHDYFVSVVQAVVEALLFYHPAVWWVSGQIRHERECCCDDIAVAAGGDAMIYARALTALAQRSLYPQVTLGANGGVLTRRIKRLLIAESTSLASQVAAAGVLALLVLSALTVGTKARAEAGSSLGVAPAIAAPAPLAPAPLKALPVKPLPKTRLAGVLAGSAPEPASTTAAQQADATPLKVAGGVVSGNILYKVAPEYPAAAKTARVRGSVALHAVIGKTGDILSLQVISGPDMLLASALDAVRQWKYKPFLLNGEPTEVETTITVNYSIAGDEEAPLPALPALPAPAQEVLPRKIVPPQVIFAPEPEFSDPTHAKNVHAGHVQVSLVVDEHGLPTQVEPVRRIGSGLEEKAVEAVRQYRFKPATDQGKPVDYPMNIEINYQIF